MDNINYHTPLPEPGINTQNLMEGIFFPDNDKRQTRLIELGTDSQNFLYEATNIYEKFQQQCIETNQLILDTYNKADLSEPDTDSVDIFKDVADASAKIDKVHRLVTLSKIITGIADFTAAIKYLAPAATRFLVHNRVLTAEFAARVLISCSVPIVGREIRLTVGGLAEGIAAGVAGTIAIAATDLRIDAFEGSIVRDKLRRGIHDISQLRTIIKLALEKTKHISQSLNSIKISITALESAEIPITKDLIKDIVKNSILPEINKAEQITETTINIELNRFDNSRNSWTNEDQFTEIMHS
jgi:hypothetical protein